ncbi:MAG: NAD(P)/FAD-dependent oxidoreductase [Lachnospiraceae bacterium]|nr:NAD(P)/FAD-dependent oxidoreductase [Lachnospiraceae bacterium]
MSKVIVIGGGAAGMMAAISAAKKGHRVALYEKNEKLGKKVFITGKGRCNVTNACEVEDLFQNVISNPKFLYSGFYGFDNQAVMQFFEDAGCRLKIERGERVFPLSDHSSDIIRALQEELRINHVMIYLNTTVKEIKIENGKMAGVILKDGTQVVGNHVIVATGGKSYPLTGSTGDGYIFAQKAGHTITKLKPALVPFEIKESHCKELQGLALKNVQATVLDKGKELYTGFGEMLFTHYGVSGPLILSASSLYAKKKKENSENAVLRLDLKPALSEEQLDKRVLRDFEENKNKQFKNAMNGLFPSRLIPVMIEISGINPEKAVHEISREERQQFVHRMKNWEMTILGLRDFNEAIITQGGVSVKEINPSTLESKFVKHLYFVGEVLDLDALTGGFNLQIAWSTGFLAGEGIE